MGQVINTNIASLTAQRNLAANQNEAATAMQRLSSGLRINSAKDDAAGLAIANRLTSQINGINQAVRNANDGISVVQIAEGALSETSDILQRMRTLAVQSANASYNDADRSKLQSEIDQLVLEVDRIAFNTAFGDTKVLNGSYANRTFQVGANAGETLNIDISSAKASNLGQVNTLAFGTAGVDFESAQVAKSTTSAITKQDLTFTVDNTETTVGIAAGDSAKDIASKISTQVGGLTASGETVSVMHNFASGLAATETISFKVNGVAMTAVGGAAVPETTANNIKAAIDAQTSLSGLTVSLVGTIDGTGDATTGVQLVDADGDDITIELTEVYTTATPATKDTASGFDVDSRVSSSLTTLADGTNGEKSLVGGDTAFVTGHVSFTTSEGTTDTVKMTGAGTAAGQLAGSNLTATITAGTDRIADVKVDSVTEANKALGLIDAALSTINTQRAELGAVQSRLDSVVSNLMNVSENSAAAKSRIMDADFAAETAQLAKSQILQQAGISVLAQANAQPQNVLALLQ